MPGKQSSIPAMFKRINRKRRLSMEESTSSPAAAAKRRHVRATGPKSPDPRPSPRRSLRNQLAQKEEEKEDDKFEKFSPLPHLTWANHQRVWSHTMMVPDQKNKETRGLQMFEKNPEILPKMRAILLDWLIEVAEVYKLRRETYYLAQDFVDRVLFASRNTPKTELQLLGITCMFIAAKTNEIYPPNLCDFAYVTDGACTEEAIVDHESYVLNILDWNVFTFTPTDWLCLFLQNSCRQAETESKRKFEVPHFPTNALAMVATLLDLATLDSQSLVYSYSVLAATAFAFVYGRERTVRASSIEWADLTDCIAWMSKFAIALHVKGMVRIAGSLEINNAVDVPLQPKLAFTDAPQDASDSNLLQTHKTTIEMLTMAQQSSLDCTELQAPPKPESLEKTPTNKQREESASLEMAPMKSSKSASMPSYSPKELFQSQDSTD